MDDETVEGEEPVDIELAPDPEDDVGGGGSSSGSATCGTTQIIAYSASKLGTCCIKLNGDQGYYKPYRCTASGCTNLICASY